MLQSSVLIVTTASIGLARSEADHLYNYDHVYDPYSRASRPDFDPIFVESDSFRRPEGHLALVRSPSPGPITVSSPSPYHNYQQYPYFSHLTPTNRPLVPAPSSPSPSPSPSPYDYPLPPIPTYPPTPAPVPGYHRGQGLPPRPLRPVRPPPSITFLDPDPLQPSPPSPSNIEVRPRSFTPRPHTPEPRPANDHQEEENTGEQTSNEAHLPALTLSEESGDDVTDDVDDYEGVNYDETIPPPVAQQTQETEYEYSDEDEIDPSEVFPELATEAPTHETVTEAIPDVTENEVETQATLIEVLDEIFEDPSLPREEHQDVPRSPQFFVPTPIPAVPSQPALSFESLTLDEDEHAFHNHFLSSVEGEASLVGKMFRDEQDIAEQEALHHHGEHEEGHHEVAENEIKTSVTPRPSEHKGRRVLKKRPIRIKIPAGIRQNLQVIPESLTQDVKIQDDDIIIATPTTTVTPSLAFQEPAAFNQQQVFNPNLLNRPTTPSPRLEPVLETEQIIQEPRQPKALTVFSADYEADTPEEVIFGQQADNVRQQEAVPQNFSPIFAVPSEAAAEEPRSAGLLLQQQNVNIDTSAGRSAQFAPTPAAPAVPGFNAAQTAANSPPTFRPILRQPSDYIFTPQQFAAPAIQQQQQPQQFANSPFQQQTQQQFRQPAEVPRQQFRPQSFQQQDQDFNFASNQQQQAFTSFSPPVSQRQPAPQAPALTFQEPTREQKAFPQQQAFNNNFLSRPATPAPQQQQQFNTNFAPRPQEIAPPQTFTQSTPAPPPQQQQQQFNNNFAPRPQEVAPPQTFSQSTPPPPTPTFSTNNNFNNNFGSVGIPPASPAQAQNGEQSLFAMINKQAADRPVRTKLQQSDKSILRNTQKSSSSALENLLSIAGKDWDTNLHVAKTTAQASDFTCPAVEGHYPDPEACNIYHQCAGGVAHATTCQPGLAWNVVINMCDWEANVDCDINRGLKPIPIQEEGQQQSQQPQQQSFSQFAPAFTAFLF